MSTTPATQAAAARGIRVEPVPPDEYGNTWQAVIPRPGRSKQPQPMVALLAGTPDDAARAALHYIGARGWQA